MAVFLYFTVVYTVDFEELLEIHVLYKSPWLGDINSCNHSIAMTIWLLELYS